MAKIGDRIRDMAELVALIGGAIAAVAKVADIAKDIHDRSKRDRSKSPDRKHEHEKGKDADAA